MIVLGLTGSIGMGKTTTAAMFAEMGVPVLSADDIVHRLYRGAAVPAIATAFPGTVQDGAVDRDLLAKAVVDDPGALTRLEGIVHPLVQAEEDHFLRAQEKRGAPIVLLDIPLLLETGGEARVDRIVVVTADAEEQRERVMARPGMTEERFEALLARQIPDAQKRERADYVIDTGKGLESARSEARAILDDLVKGS